MHLMIVLREYEDFGTHNRRRKRLAETEGQTQISGVRLSTTLMTWGYS